VLQGKSFLGLCIASSLLTLLSQKYSKVKTRDKELFGNGAAATTMTPSKAKKDTPSKASAKRASNGKTKQAVPVSEDSEDEELFETPSKKVKMVNKEEETSDDMGSAMEEE
jgi:3-oxoacyl-[acyl-carrier-protein] synthase III